MDRESLIRRLEMMGIPYGEGDLDRLLSQYRGFVDAYRLFPDMDPLGDEPVMIFHPEVGDDNR